MYIFKNSMKNLFRNRGRNILIFLILLVTITAVTTCAIIRQTANDQIDEFVGSFKPAVSMTEDFTSLSKDFPTQEKTAIDGSTYYVQEKLPDFMPTEKQCEEWAQNEMVDHAEEWLNAQFCADLVTFDGENVLHGEDMDAYYGKDITFFRNLAEADYETKKAYYLSEQFPISALFERLYEKGHTVTEQEAEELAARTIFGDDDYKEYLENGISDELAAIAFGIKTGYGPTDIETYLGGKAPSGYLHAFTDFEKGAYFTERMVSLAEGNYPYGENECLVSKRFAELNHLSVGDKFTVSSTDLTQPDVKIELTISGLFNTDLFDATAGHGADSFVDMVFTSVETLKKSGFAYEKATLPTYYLNSTQDVEAFKTMLRETGLSEYMALSDNLGELEQSIQAFQKAGQFATILMVITLILGGAIFLLLNFLAVGERKYEIGVLRSIGMKKKKIMRGFLYETAVITILCCVIGMTVGTAVSQPVANYMMEQQSGSETTGQTGNMGDGMVVMGGNGQVLDGNQFVAGEGSTFEVGESGNVTQTEKASLMVHLSWITVLEIIGAAFVLMMAAVMIASLYITKFEPIRILSDQE